MQNILNLIVALILAIVSLFGLDGCATTKAADGTTTTRVDVESTVAILQTSITLAQNAYTTWAAEQGGKSEQEFQQGLETRKANIELLQVLLNKALTRAAAK